MKRSTRRLKLKFIIMDHYYVNRNAQETDKHEVHTESCWYLPEPENRIDLGNFSNCKEALEEAKGVIRM